MSISPRSEARGSEDCHISNIKVRPHGQQFGHTILYNKVVRHKSVVNMQKVVVRPTSTHPQFFL